ncbi:MAG: restriction endonuclease subunit S [Saprospirales bacterium]|nr:restriction endonuclease subunit S [Saprospirales bacterium]
MTKNKNAPALRFPGFEGEWEVSKIGPSIDFLSGYPFDGKDISDDYGGVPLMRGVNITEGSIRHAEEFDKYYCGDVSKLEKYFLKEGDLVIGMDGSKVGKNSAIIDSSNSNSLLVQRVARIRSLSSSSLSFIYHHINSNRFHKYVDEVKTSSGIPHISAQQIKISKFSSPPSPSSKKSPPSSPPSTPASSNSPGKKPSSNSIKKASCKKSSPGS